MCVHAHVRTFVSLCMCGEGYVCVCMITCECVRVDTHSTVPPYTHNHPAPRRSRRNHIMTHIRQCV